MPVENLTATFTGYLPEYRTNEPHGWTEWERVEFRFIEDGVQGIPFPRANGGFLKESYLLGESQAWAIAWLFAAHRESRKYGDIEVRIVPYRMTAKLECIPAPNESQDAETLGS